MLLKGNRMIFAFFGSVLIHIILISGFFVSKDFINLRDSGEVYESMDLIEHLEGSLDPVSKNRLISGRLTDVDLFELVIVDDSMLQKAFPQMKKLEIPDLKNVIKNKPKVAPIVRSPMVKPKLLNASAVPYPVKGEGKTGTVVVCILVGSSGRPEYVSTAASSGNPVLDGAAIEHCIGYRFLPAQDDNGNYVRCLVYIPVEVSP